MLILLSGKVVRFNCESCNCGFVVGINRVTKDMTRVDNVEYYANCPACGDQCHTNANGIQKIGMEDKE